VVVHRNLLSYLDESEQPIPELVLRQSLGPPFYDDGNFIGFRVPQKDVAPPTDEAIILGDGWYPKGQLYKYPVQGMLQTGTLLIYEPEPAMMRLSITAFTTMPNDATVTMSINDTPIETFQLPSTSATPKTHLTRAFSLSEGLNEAKFEVQHVGPPTQQLNPRAYLGVYDITPQNILHPTDVSPMHQMQINLGDKIELIGYDLNPDTIHGGETLNLTLYWHALAQMDDSYKVFIHLLDQHGNKIAQYDAVPHNWMLPTTAWGRGEVIKDEYNFPIPPDVPRGQYQIWTGMYSAETLQRLNVHMEGGSTTDDSILLGDIDAK